MVNNTFKQFFLAASLLPAIAGCAATMDTGSHCSVDPNFLGTENTFSWGDAGPIKLIDESGYISPMIVEQLKLAVINELGRKGFRFIKRSAESQPADVKIELYLRARREVITMTNTRHPCNDPDCWQTSSLSGAQASLHTIGFLAADVFYLDKPVWRGWVERNLFPSERDNAQEVIALAVPILFQTFPP